MRHRHRNTDRRAETYRSARTKYAEQYAVSFCDGRIALEGALQSKQDALRCIEVIQTMILLMDDAESGSR